MSSNTRRITMWSALAAVFAMIFVAPTPEMDAQAFASYSEFQAMSVQQLATLQVKVTHVGPRKDVIPSIAFTSPSNVLDLSLFVPFRRPGISYESDDLSVHTFTATLPELKAVIDNVATLPNVTAGAVAAAPYVSFTLSNTANGTKVFDTVLNVTDSADLIEQLRRALTNNRPGRRFLSEMACALGVLEAERPADASSNVKVSIGGPRLDRATGHFIAPATIQNVSATSIAGPISLVLMSLSEGLELVNPEGTTCGTEPVGRPFINVPLVSNALAPAAQATVNLEFENSDRLPIAVSTKVLAGVGAR